MRFLVLILTLFSLESTVYSQPDNFFPSCDSIFIDSEVPKIEITISGSNLSNLLAPGNEESNIEYPATFIFTSSQFTQRVNNVGIRLRGNTSRVSKKKSFKVSFNTFIQGQKFLGIEKLNLNGEHNDPSIIRSKLCWDLLHSIGIPAPRANHIALYINGEYKGLYINVEHIDEEFVKMRFGNNNGNLYKCLWPADLSYKGTDQNSYKSLNSGRRAYDLKTNLTDDDYSDLVEFIDIINNYSLTILPNKLETIFNVNNYLKYLAVEAVIGNWDGYSYNKNNFYLYHNQKTGQFEFIPYDLDNTLGIDWFGIDWAQRNIYAWYKSQELRPLTKRILQVPEYKDKFSFYVRKLIVQYFNSYVMSPRLENIKSMITPFVSSDTYRELDYGWDMDDFNNSYYQTLGGHVKYGLIPYIQARYNSAFSQLQLNDVSPIVSNISYQHVVYSESTKITASIDDEDLNPFVKFYFQENGSGWDVVQMIKDNNGQYSVDLSDYYEPTVIDFYLTALDNTNKTTREPRNGFYRLIMTNNYNRNLLINEIMSNNNSTVRDDCGEFSDWIELYNPGPENIWLGDKFLSDNLNNSDKWQMPDTILNANDYIVFWADATESQGIMHTSFKLSSLGEEVGLFDSKINGNTLIDGFTYPQFENDFSIGRFPDGIGFPVVLSKPSPGNSNSFGGYIDRNELPELYAFPNPFSEEISIQFSNDIRNEIVITITDIFGKILVNRSVVPSIEPYTFNWNAKKDGAASGIYILKMQIKTFDGQPLYLPSKKLIFLPK